MSSSESEIDDGERSSGFYYWDNWIPPGAQSSTTSRQLKGSENPKNYGCWLPPKGFGKTCQKSKHAGGNNKVVDSMVVPDRLPVRINDWGPRLVYGSALSDIEEGEHVWNIFFRGMFDHFKLWRNEYGHIVAYADAKFDNGVPEEQGLVQINKEVLLRKLLGASTEEWAALVEAKGPSKWVLKHEALARQGKPDSSVDMLWFYLCKCRHLLPSVAIRMKKTGLHKMTSSLKILPKFTVEDVKTFNGEEII